MSYSRRSFLKKAAMGAAGAVLAPYILPSGRVFAQSGSRRVGHVVFCLFAGGVRNIESVHQGAGGNLMRNLLAGQASAIPGLTTLPDPIFGTALQSQAALWSEFRYKEGPTGHFNGHTVALTGTYTDTGLNLAENPAAPTVFEYYLKHNSPSRTALNAWWISDSLGPYVALNYSRHPQYGSKYGGNFIAPAYFPTRELRFNNMASFSNAEASQIATMRQFLDASFGKNIVEQNLSMVNTPEDAERLRNFFRNVYTEAGSVLASPLGLSPTIANGDVLTIALAELILKEFTPELTVVNMTAIDVGHRNYTDYCDNIRIADHAVAHLWQTIQSTPGMANDTVLIIAPEHGRNREPNSLVDAYGNFALDHTGDATSREIFCMMLGPAGVVPQGQTYGSASRPVGQSIDIVPTIADLLGFLPEVPGGLLAGTSLLA